MNNKTLLAGFYLAAVVLSVYLIGSAIFETHGTGTLIVKTSDSKAFISITQDNHQAAKLGIGSAKTRLAPGTYYLYASDAGQQANTIVTINKSQVTNSYLNLSSTSTLPTVDNINFQNLGTLIDSGLTTNQIDLLRQYFFNYKSSAQKVVIEPASVQHGPHNPNTSTSFTLNFNVSVDSVSLIAKTSYSNASSIQLLLYDSNNNLIFDSSAANTQKSAE